MNPIIGYSLARVGLLVVALGLGYVAGLRNFTLIVAAFLGSGIVSFFVLNNQRSSMGARVDAALSRINDKIDNHTRKEDVD